MDDGQIVIDVYSNIHDRFTLSPGAVFCQSIVSVQYHLSSQSLELLNDQKFPSHNLSQAIHSPVRDLQSLASCFFSNTPQIIAAAMFSHTALPEA